MLLMHLLWMESHSFNVLVFISVDAKISIRTFWNQMKKSKVLKEKTVKVTVFSYILSLSLSLSLCFPLLFCGVITSTAVFLLHFNHIFGVGLPTYFSSHSPFSREHIFVGFNEFPSLVYCCIVIHHHRPQMPTLFRVRWDFRCVQCNVCIYTGPPVLSPIWEDKVMYS